MSEVNSSEIINSELRIFNLYQNTKYFSIKHSSYFQVYEEIFSRYVGKQLTFVEVGLADGGSLFMWREYFGPSARIIGIDIDPNVKEYEKYGFEIFIGDQANPSFWDAFYSQVGEVDILLDDGGHTNCQQIVTTRKGIENIRDGGLLVIEDVHTSYLRDYGNPSKYSFVNFAKRVVDSLNSRFPAVRMVANDYGKRVFSIAFYESIVAFNIDSRRCFTCSPISNSGARLYPESQIDPGVDRSVFVRIIKRLPLARKIVRMARGVSRPFVARVRSRTQKAFFE